MKPALQILAPLFAALLIGGCVKCRLPAISTKTVEGRVVEYGPAARARLQPYFQQAAITYPPQRLTLVGLKAERQLQVYATARSGAWRLVRAYPILGASGVAGPKLREWDRQVPEGIYPIELLNPNSRYEISMQIGYPNAFDRQHAAQDARTNLGGDIMIHGGTNSIGCLAMGDDASAELFVLTADTGLTNVTVILAPADFRAGKPWPAATNLPAWTSELYRQIQSRLAEFPLPSSAP